MKAMTKRVEGAVVAATKLLLSRRAIAQEPGNEPAQDCMYVLSADIHLAGDLRRLVAL
jgi:hypothetical protein